MAASRGSCLSSPVGGSSGSGCSQVGNKISDPSSPGSPGPSSSRPSTPLVNSVNSISTISPASSPQTAAAQLKNCLRSSQHTVNQARTSMQLGMEERTHTLTHTHARTCVGTPEKMQKWELQKLRYSCEWQTACCERRGESCYSPPEKCKAS